MLMFVASFLTIMAIGGFPSFVEEMKEILNGHYGARAFVVGNILSSTPYLLLIFLIPGAIAYYPVGLHGGSERFVYFTLVFFACMTLVERLMMIVDSTVQNFLMVLIVGAGIQGLMMLSLWLPKRSPQDLLEIGGLLSTIDGDEVLRDVLQVEMGYTKWVDLGVLLGMVVLYRVVIKTQVGWGDDQPDVRPVDQQLYSSIASALLDHESVRLRYEKQRILSLKIERESVRKSWKKEAREEREKKREKGRIEKKERRGKGNRGSETPFIHRRRHHRRKPLYLSTPPSTLLCVYTQICALPPPIGVTITVTNPPSTCAATTLRCVCIHMDL
ncbi:hypothetical protein TEA_005826 [Camellia sinensis var. sinensis]|uniref:ABC-2 type transporter transmembrane domain-containing protein n=1 Tax=Camellia sinensis var. sinensis TaxID=542762 RepID=A0A4S4EUV4_CAMSN|nr:hypothetical protein TEA_005826 [Camellia sinensis var. sinensis]